MQDFNTKTVREIALEMPAATRVFEEFKIDYCCGGGRMLTEACRHAGVSPAIVLQQLEEVSGFADAGQGDWLKTATLGELVDHIEQKHHVFTKNELAQLPPLIEKVARVHGEQHPELLGLQDVFRALGNDLTTHLLKEETILFPYIREIEVIHHNGLTGSPPVFGTVRNPVRMMMTEHDAAGELLRQMRELAADYTLPAGACPSFTGLFHRLTELERDLHEHIHLENNLLFPRAIELEQRIFD